MFNPAFERTCASYADWSAQFTRWAFPINMDALRVDIFALFDVFLPSDLVSRWAGIALKTPARWSRIDPWKVWALFDQSCMDHWQGTVDRKTGHIIWDSRIAPYRMNRVVVLACGHSKPVLHEVILDSVIGSKSPHSFLEGFISIIPGKLGLAVNHNGEIIVLQCRT